MQLMSVPFNKNQKDELLRSLDGCICRICVTDDPLEMVRMVGFANHYLGMLAQDRILQLREDSHNG